MVFGFFKGFGRLPLEYNDKVHGPYDPAIFYGKKDTPLAEVKLAELPAWLGRRKMSPRAMTACINRGWWRWQHKYTHPLNSGITPIVHIVVGTMIFFYCLNYEKLRYHKHYKYQW